MHTCFCSGFCAAVYATGKQTCLRLLPFKPESMSDDLSVQEVELPADVQRNLNAAIAALEELEQHRDTTLGLKQGT